MVDDQCRGNERNILLKFLHSHPYVNLLLLLVLTSSTFPQEQAWAGAFQIFDQGAAATGQGGAFAAQADDPTALYYNPAGITQLRGIQASIGTNLIGGQTNFTSPSGNTTSGNFDGSIASPPPSQFYVTANLKDLGLKGLGDLSAGLAVVSPFGVLYRYPDSSPFATAVTKQSFQIIDIKPTLAFRVNDWLSLGVGADIYTFTSLFGEGVAVTKFRSSGGPGLPPAGTSMEINGKDTAAGFNVSMLATPLRNADGKPLANIGLIYRSQATMHLAGDFLVNGARAAGASTTVVLPQVITGAVSLWPVRNAERDWKLEVDVTYTGWQSVRNLNTQLSTGATIPFPENWKSGYTIMVGTEHKWLNPNWLHFWDVAVRAGYWNSQNAIPDGSFIPTIPDANQNAVSIGLGFFCRDAGHFLGMINCGSGQDKVFGMKGIGVDFAYQAILYETRTVSGAQSPLAIPGVIDGTYQTTFHVGSVNLRVAF